jgi:hypothetical protein
MISNELAGSPHTRVRASSMMPLQMAKAGRADPAEPLAVNGQARHVGRVSGQSIQPMLCDSTRDDLESVTRGGAG